MSTTFHLSLFEATGAGQTAYRTMNTRFSETVNARDFGAVGDGTTNDTTAMQAAFDAAFGPESAPHGESNTHLNRPLYIPAGTYLVNTIRVNHIFGGHIYGDGHKQTILKFTGTGDSVGGSPTLLWARTLTYSRIEGITLDANGRSANVAVFVTSFTGGNDGTQMVWIDVCFKNGAAGYVIWAGGGGPSAGSLGSEQLFLNCIYDNCENGHRLVSSNALDHNILGGLFINNGVAVSDIVGGFNYIIGAVFANNSHLDIHEKQHNCPCVVGCYSTSTNFAAITQGSMIANVHKAASAGSFLGLTGLTYNFGSVDTESPCLVTLDGNLSSNGKIVSSAGGDIVYPKGNSFPASPFSGFSGTTKPSGGF